MHRHILVIVFLLVSLTAHAARILPRDVQAGRLNGHAYPIVTIGGEAYRLAPGARIYDSNNRIILPTQLPQSAKVFYQLDSSGLLFQVWLPTPEEEAGMNR